MRYRPLPTHEVAKLCGVTRGALGAWRTAGHLPCAPKANPWHQNGSDLLWSIAAVKEAVEYAAARKSLKERRADRMTGAAPAPRGNVAA